MSVFFASLCFAEMYLWRDEQGTTHYTNDINTIPKQFRNKAKLILKSNSKEEALETGRLNKAEKNKKEIKDINKHKVIVHLLQSGSALIVPAKLNGSEPAFFIVDTGATITTISPKIAAKLNIDITEETPSLSVRTANGVIEAPLINLESIEVGGVEQNDVMAIIHDAVPEYSGLLGLTFLNEFNYSINPMDQVLVLDSLENSAKAELFGGHSQKWWQRKFKILRGFIRKEKNEMEELMFLKEKNTDEKALSLMEDRIQKKQINLNYFYNELEKLDSKATLSLVPIQWIQRN